MLSLHQCGDQLITWVGSDAVCLCRARRSGIETSGVGSVGHRRRADTLRALLPPVRQICRLTLRVSERVTEHRLMRLS